LQFAHALTFLPLRWQRKLSLNLATLQTIGESYFVSAASLQITGHITVLVVACEIHPAHVRTMSQNASETKA
jgi:hypothetical protein